MAHSRVSCFYQDSEGFLWMGSWIGLCRYDGQQFTFFRATPSDDNPQSNNRVTKIGETPGGQLWCMTYDRRLYSFDRQRCTFANFPADSVPDWKLQHNSAHRVNWSMTDAFGVRWLFNAENHFCWEDSLTGELHPVEEALDDNHYGRFPINDFHIFFSDQASNLWVSSGTRLFKLSFGQRQVRKVALPELTEIRSMMQEEDGKLLLGDKEGHLCRTTLDGDQCQYLNRQGRWQLQPTLFAAPGKGIYKVLHDQQDRLWIATRGDGLYCLEQGRVRHFLHQPSDPYSIHSNDIYSLLQDRDGALWAATFEGGGLCHIEETATGEIRFLHHGNSWPEYPKEATFVRCLTQDMLGRILAGTNEGLLIHNPATGQWQLCRHVTSDAQSLPGNMVMSILTRADTVYVQSYGFGISRMETDPSSGQVSFQTISNPDYPFGDICVSAQIDDDGRVWSIGESGFSCYTFGAKGTSLYFNDFDFGGRYTFGEAQPLLLPSGEMLLGMQSGLFVFDVRQLHKQFQQPDIKVTRLGFSGSTTNLEHYVCGLDTLWLTSDQRSVSIQFSAMDFQSSSLMRYAYRLVDPSSPILPDWTITTKPEVHFINLPAGEFQLQMRSTNAHGVWCNNQTSLLLYVIPTFWETRSAWLVWALIVLTLSTAIGYTVTYIFRLRRQKIDLEAILERHMNQPITAAPTDTSEAPADTSIPPLAEPQADGDHTSHAEDPFLSGMMTYIEAHIADDNLSVASLAEQMNMSQTTLYRKLKTMVGLSPSDFFRKVKMRRAVQYLVSSDLTISQVAYSVGFTDPKYFSKCFKHDMGLTPLEYRQRHQSA